MGSEGWWNVKKGECKYIPISKRAKDNWHMPYSKVPRVYYHVRTYGDEPLYWRGTDSQARTFCINPNKRFKARLDPTNDCSGDLREQAFRFLEAPTSNSSEMLYLDF